MSAWTARDAAELRDLEAAFAEAGGRGVDLAERIDELRARREGQPGPAGDDLAADRDEGCCPAHAGGILLTRDQLREWAGLGRDLTGDELAQLDECIGLSSIPDAIGTIVSEALKLRAADHDGGGARSTGSGS